MIKKLLNTKISKENKKGFTLAELLIVVAIIGVLVAISIPIFTSQLEKSREATDVSNVRSAAAQVAANYLSNGSAASVRVPAKQQNDATWEMGASKATITQQINGVTSTTSIPLKKVGGSYVVSIAGSTGKISVG